MRRRMMVVLSALMFSLLMGCGGDKTDSAKDGGIQGAAEEQLMEKEEKSSEGSLGEEMEVLEEPVLEDTEEPTTEEEKITVTFESKEEERTLEDGTVILEVAINKPTVVIKDNEEAQNRIQEDIDKNESDFYINSDEMEAEAKAFFSGNTIEDDSSEHFFNQLTYESARVDETVISFVKNDVSYSGGAHGYAYQSGVNYDSKTGEILTLDNIASDKETLVSCVKAYIIEVCDNGEYKDAVFPDYKDYVDSVIEDDKWYLDDTGIVFMANAYELGPYAAGTLTFHLDYKDVEGLKDAYKK